MEPTTVLADQGSNIQEINCIGKNSLFSFPIYGHEVVVNASKIDSTEANTASNKVKVSQISKYNWEEKFYHGNLVSCNTNFVAYVLKRNKEDKSDQIRVINHQTSTRQLVHGPKKEVVDISFESVQSNQLACVDSEGTLFVFNVEEKNPGKILVNLIITIQRTDVIEQDQQHLVWAPYLLLSKDTHESMIALSNGNNAEVYNIKKIQEAFNLDKGADDTDRKFNREDLGAGVKIIKDCHAKTITCLSLSPDTNVLVTCSLDGHVKFWSLSTTEDPEDPEGMKDDILHEWVPHDGEPVTSLLFCDDLLEPVDVNPFWRYLITGTSSSSVLKIWCAVKWKCLQTIEFAPYVDQIPTSSPCMKLALDISAKFLIMADIHRPVLYICYLSQIEKEKMSVISISEFVLKEPLLSFTILAAKDYKSKHAADEAHNVGMVNGVDGEGDHSIDDLEDGIEKKIVTSVKLFAVQKREVQRLSIKYSANHSIDLGLSSAVSTAASSQEDLMSIKDALSDSDCTDIYTDKLLLQESAITDESIGSSITAVTNVTVNGNYEEGEDDHSLNGNSLVSTLMNDNSLVSTLMNDNSLVSMNDNSLISTLTGSVTNSFADTILTVKENNNDIDLMGSITEPLTNDLMGSITQPLTNDLITSLSIESHPPSMLLPLEHHDSSIILAVSTPKDDRNLIYTPKDERNLIYTPKDERNSIYIRGNSSDHRDLATQVTPTRDIAPTHTTEQLVALLNNQQQILSNQQQVLISQQQELKEMKDMMKQLLQKQTESMTNSSDSNDKDDLKVYMQLWQKNTNKEFNKVCSQKLDQFNKNMDMFAEQREKQNLQILSNIVNNTIAIKVENTIKQEMKPLVINSLEKMHTKHMEKVNSQISQTLNDKLCSATGILQGTIPNAFTECFTQIILPGFEKALMAMFGQVDKLFRQGTSQYLEHLSKHLDAKRQKQHDAQDPLLGHLQELIQSFQATADRLTSGVETNLEALMQKQLCDSLDKMQNSFCKTVESRVAPSITESITSSLTDAMEDFKMKLSASLAESMYQSTAFQQPDAHLKTEMETKAVIMKLVDQGNYNKAFEEALTAANLSLVMYLCKQIEPNGIFTDVKCPFPQPIILSLIQQLSVNLAEDTETKRRYLEESIMALDKDDEITREHLPVVLQGLNEQLNQAIDMMFRTDSSNVQLKPLKMLLMASRSLLHGS